MAIGSGGGVPSTKGLPVVKGFGSFTPTQAPPVPFFQSDDSNSYSIINAGRVAVAAVVIASGGLFMPPLPPVLTPDVVGVPVSGTSFAPTGITLYYQSRFEPPPLALAPVATPSGWQSQLSFAPPTATAFHVSYDLPTVPAAVVVVTPPSEIGIPLYSGSAPPRYRRVYFQTRSEPPYLAPAAAATTVEGWQSALSVAPPTATAFHVSYDLPSLAPSAAPTGWTSALSVAPRVAKAVQTWPQVPFNTAQLSVNFTDFDWYAPLSVARPVTKAQAGFASVPYSTPQLSVNFTPFGWQGPLETAPRPVKAQAGFASVPYNQTVTVTGWQSPLSVAPSVARVPDNDYSLPLYTAVVVDNTVTIDKWQPALSAPPLVTKAQAGFASVPFNTVQINPDAYTALYLQPLSVAPPVVKAQPGFSSVPLNTAQLSVNFTPLGWHQALSTAPAVTKAAAYFGSVPLNTAQLSVNFTDFSWAQPLAGAPPVANAQSPDWTLPYAVVNVVSTSWQSALSVAPDVAKAQPDFGQLPAYPLQASPVGIAGMAWFTPLWTVPTRNLVAQPGNSSVPFNTTQQIVVTTPGRRRPILFIANVGRLMN